jgi:cold shock CspA family protein
MMNIDFGIVKKYFSNRGFGFVTHTFLAGHQSEVFFHIKKIKSSRPDLAEKLDNDEPKDTIYFWYETENTSKGEQIRNVLQSDVIHNMATDNLSSVIGKIESIWSNIDSTIPVWLRDVTVDLVGSDQARELNLERKELEEKRQKEREALQKIEEAKRQKLIEKEKIQKEIEEKRQKEREALQKIEEVKRQKLIEKEKIQKEIEEKEFEQLVAEMKFLGMTQSNQVSSYIMKNKLGYKYKNISGIVTMEKDGTSWNFNGGFPSRIYAMLCKELGLKSKGTQSRVVGFKSFKDL